MENTNDAPPEADFDPADPALKNRVVIMNGFSDQEIVALMRAVKSICRKGGGPDAVDAAPGDLIFAKSTPRSLRTALGALIVDMSADHEYLRKNPPGRA